MVGLRSFALQASTAADQRAIMWPGKTLIARRRSMRSDNRLLNDLFEQNYGILVAWCRSRNLGHLGDPEEFVHLAYLRCSRRWSAEHRSSHCELSYVYRALRWVMLDALRRRGRQRTSAWPLRYETASGRATPLHTATVREAVERLKGRPRQVCHSLMAGKDEERIGQELQISRNAVAVHVHRAKARICRDLEMHRPSRSRCIVSE